MANPFLNTDPRDIETAIMLDKAIVHDIGKAVAFTDGRRVFINTDDNLNEILPAYNHDMLKWLLWHERMHQELRHHNRFFKYLEELSAEDILDEFHVTKEEVNIIMDILVHDSLSKMFPELVETAINNLAQMRNRNSLEYTFTTFTLEEMLDEYSKHKHGDDGKDGEGEGEGMGDEKAESTKDSEGEGEGKGDKDKEKDGKGEPTEEKGHGSGGGASDEKGSKPEDGEAEVEQKERPEPLPDEHDKTDWSKLEDRDSKEFISESEANRYEEEIAELKRKKLRLATLTETLNSLATSTRKRTYAKPSTIKVGGNVILKGTTPGRASLYLVFDASGSMGYELNTFKEIISKSIPQAMNTPTEWFSGEYEKIAPYKTERSCGYFKGKFSDIMPVRASSGYSDDGDRVIELCWQAEQKGYSPIGITDGGGGIYWSQDKLKQLKRTILIGDNRDWLEKAQKINPKVQILDI